MRYIGKINPHLILLLILGLCGLQACSDGEKESMRATILDIDNQLLQSSNDIIIIPGEGCGGCISNATSYIMEHIDSLDVNVVLTGVGDMKLLRLELGDLLQRSNVFVDSKNLLMNPLIASVYPRIVKLKNGSINEVNIYNPK